MKVGIDIDGVVADFDGGWRDLYVEWFDAPRPRPSDQWDLPIEETVFSDEDEFWQWSDAAGLWLRLSPLPGALGAIWTLKQRGHVVELITSRHQKARNDTLSWVSRHLGRAGLGPNQVHQPGKDKWRIPCGIYIDDSPKVLRRLVDHGCLKVIRFVQPWNEGEDIPGVADAEGWPQVLEIVEEWSS